MTGYVRLHANVIMLMPLRHMQVPLTAVLLLFELTRDYFILVRDAFEQDILHRC